MRVGIRKILKKEEERVIVECVEITPEIKEICHYVSHMGTEISGTTKDGHVKSIRLDEVYYFEALDEKVFAYTEDDIYELKMRLYEAEKEYAAYHFVRCSKSVVMNLMLLDSISPALNGRFLAHMKNGEKLMISRQYAASIKKIVMGGKKHE